MVEALCSAGLEAVSRGLNQVLGEHGSNVAQTSLSSLVMSEIFLLKVHEEFVTGGRSLPEAVVEPYRATTVLV